MSWLDRRRRRIRLGRRVWLSLDELVHMLILGQSGKGKSKQLENIARQLIWQSHTLTNPPCLIFLDPLGDSFDALVRWCIRQGFTEKLFLFNPNEPEHIIGYNPMKRIPHLPLGYQRKRKVVVHLKAWNQQDSKQTPQISKWLSNAFGSVIEAGLTEVETPYLLDTDNNPYRGVILRRVTDELILKDFKSLVQMKPWQRREETFGAPRRIREFLDNDLVRRIITQQRRTLDLRQLIDTGSVLLINLRPYTDGLDPEDSKLLGTLLIDDIVQTCFGRAPEACTNDTVFIIDEFSDFVTSDIGKILQMGRHFRLKMILAHQHITGVREDYPRIYADAMTNTPAKIVYGGVYEDDLEALAKEMFTESIDLLEVKHAQKHTYFEPIETRRTTVHRRPSGLLFPGETTAETVGPFHRQRRRQEVSSVQFWSRAEQFHRAKARLKGLKKREFAIKLPDQVEVVFDKTPFVRDVRLDEAELEQAKERIFTQRGCYSKIEQIEAEEQERLQGLIAEHRAALKKYDEELNQDGKPKKKAPKIRKRP
ncbi:MAG: type IV secretory system conjugative DNA transfer family protein [Candidatus Binatia bacterium]